MASSGTITLNLQSIDNYVTVGQANAICWPDSRLTRGHVTFQPTFNWSVNSSGVLSVSYNGGTSYWSVNSQSDAYYLKVQFSTNGSTGWTDIMTASEWHTEAGGVNVSTLIASLTNSLGTATLTQSGYIRIYSYTGSACPWWSGQYGQDEGQPNAYPTEGASQAVAADVYVDVNWTATLKYNANGGTGAPGNQTHTQTGNSYTFTVSNTVPTRTNYRFEGWATTSSASTPAYHGGDSYTINKSDPTKTLYAVWTEFYRPGAIFVSDDPYQWGDQNGEWYTHNRGSKAAHILATDGGSTWTEMRTIDAPTGLGDPPAIYHDEKWYNQKKIGKS